MYAEWIADKAAAVMQKNGKKQTRFSISGGRISVPDENM
jgi:hypothetical protein